MPLSRTLILTFSLGEKELRVSRKGLILLNLPLPEGEGTGEGSAVSIRKRIVTRN
jgi:hypothetical protein